MLARCRLAEVHSAPQDAIRASSPPERLHAGNRPRGKIVAAAGGTSRTADPRHGRGSRPRPPASATRPDAGRP